MNETFFSGEQRQFFRPLNGKYREKVYACLRELYLRLNGPTADCRYHLKRADILEVFSTQLRNAPELDDDSAPFAGAAVMDDDRLAIWILTNLLECGWLEEYHDSVEMESAFRFTPQGRSFAKAFVDLGRQKYRASHRNTRNTRNSLLAYLETRDPHDLVEAYHHSQEIFNDFNESLEEIAEMQREQSRAIREGVEIGETGERFFQYLETRFLPDVAKMLGEESVNRYRTAILDALETLRDIGRDPAHYREMADMELAMRELYPMLVKNPEESVVRMLIGEIEGRIDNACEVKIPELRQALEIYTRRSHLIISQLARIHDAGFHTVANTLQRLRDCELDEQSAIFDQVAQRMALCRVELVDPEKLQLRARRKRQYVDNTIRAPKPLSDEEQLKIEIQEALGSAFTVEDGDIVEKIYNIIRSDGELHSQFLAISTVPDLFVAQHITAVGGNRHNLGWEFRIEETGRRVDHRFFEGKEYRIYMHRRAT